MSTVAFKGSPVELEGMLPNVGDIAPPFTLVGQGMEEVTLESLGNKRKILNIFPSMDTDVCANTVRKFSEKKGDSFVVLNISMDLPFAAKRFCEAEKLEGAVTLSAFRSSFPVDYGLKIADGPLKGLMARTVIVLNEDNRVLYCEQVPEITQEPDYAACCEALRG